MSEPLPFHLARISASLARPHLGPKDQKRLDRLIEACEIATIATEDRLLAEPLAQHLYPNDPQGTALLTEFAGVISRAAREAGIEFGLTAPSGSTDRGTLNFIGEDSTSTAMAIRSAAETKDVQRVPQAGRVDGDPALVKKPTIRYFVSYANQEETQALKLLEQLATHLAIHPQFSFERWRDRANILPGDEWAEKIEEALDACDFGLLLVSPRFLASEFITRNELPRFVQPRSAARKPDKLCFPVMLKPVHLDGKHDLKGLEAIQIFVDERRRAFTQTRGSEFCDQLYSTLHAFLVARFSQRADLPPPVDEPTGSVEDTCSVDPVEDLALRAQFTYDEKSFTRNRARRTSLESLPGRDAPSMDADVPDALEYIQEWACDTSAPPFFAVLGETGIGKTTTLRAFTATMLERRRKDPKVPLVIYLDLRHVGDAAQSSPDLREILNAILKQSWRGGPDLPRIDADDIIRLVQQGNAIAVFDGLDEVLNHLGEGAGQRFTQQLWRICEAPHVFDKDEEQPQPKHVGRLIVSCRSHFFRTLRDQRAHLIGQHRTNIDATDYRAIVILPFTEEQIRIYLSRTLPDEDPSRILALLESVHNLREMAERPMTLQLLVREIPKIEQWKLEGRKVTGALLYDHMVRSWLERDKEKHEFTPDHKIELMEHLSVQLLRLGRRTWSIGDLEQWLLEFLQANSAIALHYKGKPREVLKEDLRNATFVVREGEDQFRFAHTSLQEFFLASYLVRAIRDRVTQRWDLPSVSVETLDFVGQLLLCGEYPTAHEQLGLILGGDSAQAATNAFAYWLRALGRGLPLPSAKSVRLDGADLSGWQIQGESATKPLVLRRASFRGTRLVGARLQSVDVSEADFRSAKLTQTLMIDVDATGANFDLANLDGSRWRDGSLSKASFRGTAVAMQTTQVTLDERMAREVGRRASLRAAITTPQAASGWSAGGHRGPIYCCAFSRDATRVLSASDDGTLRVWDARTGESLVTFRGHSGPVNACAFSVDGSRALSASDDRTLRIWDTHTGEFSHTLRGHGGAIYHCALSFDGTRALSASEDQTLRIWSTLTGECLLSLKAYGGAPSDCAFSADGTQVLSAFEDQTLRAWDARSGEPLFNIRNSACSFWVRTISNDGKRALCACDDGSLRVLDTRTGGLLLSLKGHHGWVGGCAFSHDGGLALTVSIDGRLRVWNSSTGDPLVTLEAHANGATACALSHDGTRALSAYYDGTLRVWDVPTGVALLSLTRHAGEAIDCSFTPDGARAISSFGGPALRVWELATGTAVLTLKTDGGVRLSCASNRDGTRALSGSDDGTVRIWDAHTGECLVTRKGHDRWVRSCAFNSIGTRVVSASNDGTLRIWDARTGETTLNLRGHAGAVLGCAFSPDGTRVLSASVDGTLRIWDAQLGQTLLIVKVYGGGALSCAFCPDGERALSGSEDRTLRVWNARTGKSILVLRGHSGAVRGCAFSNDGMRAISASEDATLRVWDTRTGKSLATLEGHDGWVRTCAFSNDDTRAISASDDGTLRVWDAHNGDLLWIGISLPEQQWASYDARAKKYICGSEEAWRFLGWRVTDPATGIPYIIPAEAYGLIPVVREKEVPGNDARARR